MNHVFGSFETGPIFLWRRRLWNFGIVWIFHELDKIPLLPVAVVNLHGFLVVVAEVLEGRKTRDVILRAN